ncbi:MAG TPA: hypothetical protein DGT21_14825 [Armatimonadetes bacterium]|jgi:hypothetical protein|nr:hypothetical protein [Armatimonadota bacterium]
MGAYSELMDAMAEMTVIDAHEHLPEETERTGNPVDAFTLFSHYTQTDLKSAAMSAEAYERLQAPETPLEEKWQLVAPYWERIKHGSYSRPVRIAVRELYGFEDLNEDTYRPLSEVMAEHNTPGIYDHTIRELCHIEKCLTQIGRVPTANRDLLVPLLPMSLYSAVHHGHEMTDRAAALDMSVASLAEYVEVMRAGMGRWKSDGVVGVKAIAADIPQPSPGDAAGAFERVMALSEPAASDAANLSAYLFHQMLDIAGELGLIVAVHCGIIWNNYNDFYTTHPKHIIPWLLAHRNTTFDLYHAAMPWYGDMGVLAKEMPHAYLNMCWCHVISQQMSRAALDEWIDLVPVNKIIGFGGDYSKPVEKIYGHLLMAKEDIAAVLGRRVDAGLLSLEEAVDLARGFLYENPKALYGL